MLPIITKVGNKKFWSLIVGFLFVQRIGSERGFVFSRFYSSWLLGLSLKTQDVEKTHPKWELKKVEFCAASVSSYKGLNYSTPILSNNNNNNIFYQESNTFGTVILKYFTKRIQLSKRPLKSTKAFQGE